MYLHICYFKQELKTPGFKVRFLLLHKQEDNICRRSNYITIKKGIQHNKYQTT